ncbi:hypothetical protein CALVIDRAFT_568842 [Calocera viscosa TUFC12733]|uniref:Uncharacterized protein n=1 Tax=Calocera viscosa (strain TUFC12733) TaxID=1330018 RepID=A0A167GLJ6_CALVF|nr:hypothetical protein CALVIDRAFT_568842 [Calocera viscosa TUFC12733]
MANGNGKMDHETDMNLLALPPAVLLPALHARSLLLFTPSNLKASSSHLPAEVLLALILFAVKLGMYGVARDWAEIWWIARGAADPDGEDEIKGRRKIREAMVLRLLPGLTDWESASGWAEGEPDVLLQEPSDTNTAMTIPPSAPPIVQGTPRPPNILRALLRQMRESFSPVAWLFVIILPLIAIVIRLRGARVRARRIAAPGGTGVVGGAMEWLWKAVVDAVDMAGRGLV